MSNPYKDESLSGRGHDEITISSLLDLMGRGGGEGSSRTHHDGHGHGHSHGDHHVTTKMLELQRQLLQEYFQRERALRKEELQKVEEKCNVILVKVPVLESRTENIGALMRELEIEREQRRDNEKNFMECIDRLMEEIVQVNLKLLILEERIDEMENKRGKASPLEPSSEHQPPKAAVASSSSASTTQDCGNEVVGLINDLSKDIQAKFQEFGENQATLRVKIENTRKDLMDSMSYSMLPPVEAILEEPPPAPTTSSFSMPGGNLGFPPNQLPVASDGSGQTEQVFNMPDAPIKVGDDAYGNADTFMVPIITLPPNLHMGGGNSGIVGGDVNPAEYPEDDIDVMHGQAPTPGRYLPILCLCGMEYDSISSMSAHIVEEVTSRHPPTSKEVPPTSGPSGTKRGRHRANQTPSSDHGMGTESLDSEGKRRFYCKCGNSFAAKRNLEHHIRVRGSGRAFQCPLCPIQPLPLAQLRVHMKTKHNTEYCKGKRACSVCGQMFDSVAILFSHQAEVHGVTRFPANPAKQK